MSTVGHEAASEFSDSVDEAGVEGNSRLTSVVGVVLLGMLAVEGYTILDVHGMITLHIFLGIMLVGPVLLKTATTMYRFARYYQGTPAYVRKGPPHIVLRVLGPVVILSSLAVLGTGIGLLAVHSHDGGLLLTAHQASFIVWVSAMTIHVLGHIKDAALISFRELRRRSRHRPHRFLTVVVAVVLGIGAAMLLLPHASQWTHRGPDHFGHYRR